MTGPRIPSSRELLQMHDGRMLIFEKSRAGYLVVFEQGPRNWTAYVPDLPGCIVTARNLELARRLVDAAIMFHQRGLRKRGLVIPRPRPLAELRRRQLI